MESLNAFFDLLGADEAGDETYSVILLFAGKPTSCPRQCLCRANLLRGVTADLGGALLATVNLTTPSALSLRSEGIRERHLQSLSSWSERDVESRRRAALRALLTDKADICPEISTLIVDEELPVRELQTEVQTEVYPVILYGTLTCILQSIIALYAPDSLRIRGIHAGLNANSLAPI
ncbi:MAG: hypothetical protein KVP17_002054 [Porospora cf. gigantea B]|uniref:uncharacterized protein n=1 Tax=Porospora cf. gigantea B TaxID=2853592 RepID=UPI003571D84C|nr:MAG: hypothetical protein KVP17_002054 [Porospora cf. gigantea B]